MKKRLPHVGLRTIKTALAVAIALILADLRMSPAPIFAAIGAIVAMNRTIGDTMKSALTQFCGILLGVSFGYIFVSVFRDVRSVGVALGIICLISICVWLKLDFAVPLACIVFVSINLSPAQGALQYGMNRLIDTSIGLLIAFLINMAIRPYDNGRKIRTAFEIFLQRVPDVVEARIVRGEYPNLSSLYHMLGELEEEIKAFKKQNIFRQEDHAGQAAYFEGCKQLAYDILGELTSICAIHDDVSFSRTVADRLQMFGICVKEDKIEEPGSDASVVFHYHVLLLVDAYKFLGDFILIETEKR